MAKTKDITAVVSKWKRVTPQRLEDFIAGVKDPTKDWQASTVAAEANYKAGVLAAANAGRFGKGVQKCGTSKWQEKTIIKGQERWGSGVAIGDAAYAEGMQPVLRTIAATDIGPRYPSGDPRNIDRVAKIASALHKAKVGG